MVNDVYIIRFAVCAKHGTDDDMHVAFHIIQEHADGVLAEYRAQRNGRKSSSNDSLDSAIKQVSTRSLEREIEVFDEKACCAEPTNTVLDIDRYPMTKTRVNRTLLFWADSKKCLVLVSVGKHDHHDHAQPSRHFRKAHLESIERETSTSDVRPDGLRCKTVLSEAHCLSTFAAVLLSTDPNTKTCAKRLGQSYSTLVKWTVSVTYGEYSRNGEFRRRWTRR